MFIATLQCWVDYETGDFADGTGLPSLLFPAACAYSPQASQNINSHVLNSMSALQARGAGALRSHRILRRESIYSIQMELKS